MTISNAPRPPSDLIEMMEEIRTRFRQSPTSEQIVAVQTVSGNRYFLNNYNILSGKTADEDEFIETLILKEDTCLSYIVCSWTNNTLDIPSQHLRSMFLKIDPRNAKALVLLSNATNLITKKLHSLQPLASENKK